MELTTLSHLLAPIGLSALLVLMIATRRNDPFGRDEVRAVMFSGFARERLLAALLVATTCLIGATLSLGNSALLSAGQTIFGLYWLTGSLLLLRTALRSPARTRNCDPCLRALVLAMLWPMLILPDAPTPKPY